MVEAGALARDGLAVTVVTGGAELLELLEGQFVVLAGTPIERDLALARGAHVIESPANLDVVRAGVKRVLRALPS